MNFKKIIAFILCVLFLSQQTMILPVIASEITGITPGADGQFNIHPEINKGDTGFRHYNQFNLSQGDIANLIFKMKESGVDINKFVNLVDNTININGIVNTMRDNNFFNGHAIFVSPNGMVVGASGVLNVGSLTAISPNNNDYIRFGAVGMGQAFVDSASKELGINVPAIDIPGLGSLEDNMTRINAADQKGDINIAGKIIARGDVNLKAKNIVVQNTAVEKAGIVAGVGSNNITNKNGNADQIITTNQQAEKLFNALVNNDVVSGKGFGNENGKITIAAQSFRENAVITVADKIGDKLVSTIIEEAKEAGIDEAEAIQNAVNAYLASGAADATDPSSIEDNKATVTIKNAILAADDVDISATSKIDYIALKGNPMVDFISGSAIGNKIQSMIDGNTYDYEGARAKATVEIGSGADIKASGNVSAKSLAIANTNVKLSTKKTPITDTTGELYYSVGTKTVSNVDVKDGAKISADGDIKLNATSKNSQWIKIKNPTSVLGNIAANEGLLPTIQIIVLNSVTEADTNVNVENGAQLKAANLAVEAVNTTNDLTTLNSLATIDKEDSKGIAAAVAVAIKNSDINTNAKLDGQIDTAQKGDVSVTAQSLHVSSTQVTAKVDGDVKGIKAKAIKKLAGSDAVKGQIDKIISKLGLEKVVNMGESLPNLSSAVVVNDSTINTNAVIGKNADIHADNVNVNANTVDLTINSATSHVQDSSTAAYVPAPGVAVIVNTQNNTTNASIEDGDSSAHAVIKANKDLKINASLEQPMNESTFEFILGLAQTAGDLKLGLGETADAVGDVPEYIGSGEWDYELLLQSLTNPMGEVTGDIKDVKFNLNASGIKSSLGLKGFFNNWAESTSSVKSGGMGAAASVVVSEVLNQTTSHLGNFSNIEAKNITLNAVNEVTQYNAVGDVGKLWKLTDGSSGAKGGIGGSVLVEGVDNRAKAEIGDNVNITAKSETVNGKKDGGEVKVSSANNQNYLSVVMTGSKSQGGIALSGSTVVQDINGETISSIGKSKIKADTLTVKAGEAQIQEITKTAENLFDDKNNPFSDAFEDLDDSEVTLEADLGSPVLNKYKGIDENTGLLGLKESKTVKDGISNIMITGALAQEKGKAQEGGSQSSSGVAVGASVGVSEFSRTVQALIADGADIELADSLNVNADTYTQSLNIGLAGAFAGGVKVSDKGDKNKNKADSWKDKAGGLLDKLSSKLNSSDNAIAKAAGSVIKDNINSEASKGLSDSGKGGLGDSVGKTDKLTTTAKSSDASKNMSAAAAGSVNIQINDSTVEAKVGNADIKVGNNVNVTANQKTSALNIATGVANANTVGAGAAVNLINNSNKTNAVLGNSENSGRLNLTFTKDGEHNLNVKAQENNDNIQVAIGVGVAKNGPDDVETAVSAGGSFNTDILENEVSAKIANANIKKNQGKDITVNVKSDNYSTAYKGAGGMSVNLPASGTTSVGAGMAGNINLITKKSEAEIKNSVIENAKTVDVLVNSDTTKPTEELISVAAAGSVITGAKAGYSFVGAIGADVISNTLKANIENSTVTASEDLNVIAYNSLKNGNITGALSYSGAKQGAGVGLGTVVNVITTQIDSNISGSTIQNAKNISVKALNSEVLKFLAINMGAGKDATNAEVNAIVNVLKNTINSAINNTSVENSVNISVISDYDTDISGITDAMGLALGTGNSLAGNAVINVLENNSTAQITDDKTKNRKISSNGKVDVNSSINEKMDIVPVGIAISAKGSVAAAANAAVNVLKNTTLAKVSGADIKAESLNVEAADTTTSLNRGGTLAAAGKGTAVGGSVLVDIMSKNVNANISDSKVTTTGKTSVKAFAENNFGPKDAGSMAIDKMIEGETPSNVDDWQMVYDISGGDKTAVSGSLSAKISDNVVNASIENNSNVTASDVNVLADNSINTRAIIGQITGSGKAAVGVSAFVNVNTSETTAKITDSAVTAVGSEINVKASSKQDYKTITVIGAGGGNAAVTGSATVNTIDNTTEAIVDNSELNAQNGTVNVIANDSVDVESMNLAVDAGKDAAVGALAYVDAFKQKVKAAIQNNSSVTAKDNITVDASADQSFTAAVAMVTASGHASIGMMAIENIIDAVVNSYIDSSTVTSQNGKIDVSALTDYNTAKYSKKTANFIDYINNKPDTVGEEDFKGEGMLPLVYMLGVSAAGTGASISGTAVGNIISSNVNAYVNKSTIASANGLNINAVSNQMTYDAVMGVGVVGTGAAVAANAVTNLINTNTEAKLTNSVVNRGDVNLDAKQDLNLNGILFMASGTGTGASANGVVNVNTMSNNVKASIDNSTIKNNSNTNVNASNNTKANTLIAALGFVGAGAQVNGINITNISDGTVEASIKNSSNITSSNTALKASNDTDILGLIAGGSVAGTGASVGAYAPVNVLNNKIKSFITGSELNNSIVTIESLSDIDIDTIVAALNFTGTGASVGATGIVNVINNEVLAYTDKTEGGVNASFKNGSLKISAQQTTDINANIAAIAAGIFAASVGANVNTNVFTDTVKAYVNNSTLTGLSSTDVSASSTENITSNLAALAASAVGVGGAVVVNDIENKLEAGIKNSTISGGTVKVSTTQDININAGMVQVTGGVLGVGAGAVTNLLTNSNTAYIENTGITNSNSITVDAVSTEDLISNNITASGGGVAGAVGAIVNQVENSTNAYIDSKSKNITTNGSLSVNASDTVKLSSDVYSAAVGAGAEGAGVNVNILNNAVKSELLSTGTISADSVSVKAESVLDNEVVTLAAGGGIGGIAGAVSITSIGDKFDSADKNSSIKTGESVAKAKEKSDQYINKGTVSYKTSDGQEQSLNYKTDKAQSVSLASGEGIKQQGTIANINANVNAKNAVNVSAKNTSTSTIKNAAAAVGGAAAGASVLVTDMKYNTSAQINGGNVKSQNSNINVKAENTVNATTEALSATAAGIAIGGNVAYFKNKANTSAIIKGGNITANNGNVNIEAVSKDNIDSKAFSGSIGAASLNAVIALAETNNTTTAGVQDSSADITSKNLNVTSTNTSTLSSEMSSAIAAGYGTGSLVNSTASNSITEAIINTTGNINLSNDLNLISKTDGINVTNYVNMGSVALASVSGSVQDANANATFNSKIEGGNVNADNVKIKAGNGGKINATVVAKKASAGFINGQATILKANANGNTNATIKGKDNKTNNIVDIKANNITIDSSIDREAASSSSSVGANVIDIGYFELSTNTGGESKIDTQGSTLTANTIDMTINGTSNAVADMFSANLSLVSGSGTSISASTNSNSYIDAGDMNVNNAKLEINTTKNAKVNDSQSGISLVGVGNTDINTNAGGDSGVRTYGKIRGRDGSSKAKSIKLTLNDSSNAYNTSSNANYGLVAGHWMNIKSKVSSSADNRINGDISAENVTLNSNLIRTATSNATSSSGGLGAISGMNLTSEISGDSYTYAGGNAGKTGVIDNLNINSKTTNLVESYVHQSSYGLAALAHGDTTNKVTGISAVKFDGTVRADNLNATAESYTEAYMHRENRSGGFFTISGGDLINDIRPESQILFQHADVRGNNLRFNAINKTKTPQTIMFDDGSGGFIVDSGASIKNTISQRALIDSTDDNTVIADNVLAFAIQNGTEFSQEAKSDASGFTAHNKAYSELNATITNDIDFGKTSLLQGKNVTIDVDSSNTLSSVANVAAHHFAGDPGVESHLTLTVNNSMTVRGQLLAATDSGEKDGTSVNINFMNRDKSIQNLTQKADLYAEAAIATGDVDGSLNYRTNNKLLVMENGKIGSERNVNVTFDRGTDNLQSNNSYDKVSRLLFGIKIHDKESWGNAHNTASNDVEVNGKIVAGNGSQMKLTINKEGDVIGDSTINNYTKDESFSGYDKDSDYVKDELENLKAQIDALKSKKDKLEGQNSDIEAQRTALQTQIDELGKQYEMLTKINDLDSDKKISNTELTNVIKKVLDDNGVKNSEKYTNWIIEYLTADSTDKTNGRFFSTSQNAHQNGGNILKYTINDKGELVFDGYTNTGKNKDGNYVLKDDSGKTVTVYEYTLNNYLEYVATDSAPDSSLPESIALANKLITGINEINNEIKVERSDELGSDTLKYNGKVIYNDMMLKNLDGLKTALTNSTEQFDNLASIITDNESAISKLMSDMSIYQSRYDDISLNGIIADVKNGTFVFDNINASSGTININAYKGSSNVYGKGSLVVNVADVLINNYSNYNMYFSNISVGGGQSGIVVDGIAKNLDGNLYKASGSKDNLGAITINNWYDSNDPDNNTALGNLASNIIVNGILDTGVGNVTIYNESGDVTINNAVRALKTDIFVPQGSLTLDTKGANYTLAKGENLFVGKDLNITAGKIDIQGDIQAGIADKNITITQDMLDNAVKETISVESTDSNGKPVTQQQETGRYIVNLSYGRDGESGLKSDYMYSKNNIKAIYDPNTNTVVLFGAKVTDSANVNLNAASKDADAMKVNGTIKYVHGTGTVKIDNQTNANLVVNAVVNNKIDGGVTLKHNGTVLDNALIAKTVNTASVPSDGNGTIVIDTTGVWGKSADEAASLPIYNGDLSVKGTISSGNLDEEHSGLTLATNGNLNILYKETAEGSGIASNVIDTKGNVLIQKLVLNTEGQNKGINIYGKISNTGNVDIINDGNGNLLIGETGDMTVTDGIFNIKNNGTGDITTIKNSAITNTNGKITIANKGADVKLGGKISGQNGDINISTAKGDIILADSGMIDLNKDNTNQTNDIVIANAENAGAITIAGTINNHGKGNIKAEHNGTGLLSILGGIFNKNKGDVILSSTNSQGGIEIASTVNSGNSDVIKRGTVSNNDGDIKITNNGSQGVTITGDVVNKNGNTTIENTSGALTVDVIKTKDNKIHRGKIENENGELNILNDGAQGITIAGAVNNNTGVTNIINNNTSDTSGIKITATGSVINSDGNINIKNFGTRTIGLDIDGIVNAIKQDIDIYNENSNIEIGEYESTNDFYLNAEDGNITITQNNGDILNGITDNAYKTLIKTNKNLVMNVENGDIGKSSHNIVVDGNQKEAGFGVNASTRDYTESINVNVKGTVNASAKNSDNALINIRAKDSSLNVDNITSDGNVMLTAADWKSSGTGYSINNASTDKAAANVTGRNISLIASEDIGSSASPFTYLQAENGSMSAMAGNNLYLKGLGTSDNIWQLITKRGNISLEFGGSAVIREVTAGGKFDVLAKGENLTIYDLGKITNIEDNDDLLYAHDKIALSSVAPEKVNLKVLDLNSSSNSTLNIYNAYVKGKNDGTADVTLMADNIIAHAYDAASSPVTNGLRPGGFNAAAGRDYANDYTDKDAQKNLKASGFNTVGKGDALVFDIQGVSPDAVKAAGADESVRTYKPQGVVDTVEIFKNPVGFDSTVYKAKDVTLSLNSSSSAPSENRGLIFNKIYTDNAYVDTKDLNLTILDGFVTDYAEFRNGNRGGESGGHFIGGDYRWLAIVDNGVPRNISNSFGIPVTTQLYTKLSGSFGLGMGNTINQFTKAPVVIYNPYEVVNLFQNENSFYRLTLKDDKVQKTTTTPEFSDIDKSTYKPTKRMAIRFNIANEDGYVMVSDKQYKNGNPIKNIVDISKGGLAVEHDGSLKVGDKLTIHLNYHNISATPKVEVVRVNGKNAGLKFIDLDKATANKILYMNMMVTDENTEKHENKSNIMSKR